MFNVGDTVEIIAPNSSLYKFSPLDILEGSIAEIVGVNHRSFKTFYKLKILNLSSKYGHVRVDPDLSKFLNLNNCDWCETQLKLVPGYNPELNMKDISAMNVFGGMYG